MMTMKDIRAILKCSENKAKRVMKKANVIVTEKRFAHGMKNLYAVTPEQLPEMLADYEKDPEQTAVQQASALRALGGVFGRIKTAGVQNMALTEKEMQRG